MSPRIRAPLVGPVWQSQVMSFRRIEALLGASLDDATYADVLRLVGAQEREHFDLDFKQDYYPQRGPPGESGLSVAVDFASMANSVGGVIVIGIQEENSAAVVATPVLLAEAEGRLQWMQQMVLNRVFPTLAWRHRVVSNPEDPTVGFFLCILPRSRVAPHAIADGERFRYVVRDQQRNRSLHEHEIATQYRERFVRGEVSQRRLGDLVKEGESTWRPEGRLRLQFALSPHGPTHSPLTRRLVDDWRLHINDLPAKHFLVEGRAAFPRASRRRVRFSADANYETGFADLHCDGSGFASATFEVQDEKYVWFNHFAVLEQLRQQLELLTRNAQRCGCLGDADIYVRVVTPEGGDPRNLAFGRGNAFALPRITLSQGPLLSDFTVPLVRSDRESLLIVRSILSDFGQAFGFPETSLINEDGMIVGERWTEVRLDPRTCARYSGAFTETQIA